MTNEQRIDNMSPVTKRPKMGKKIAQLVELAKLFQGGTGIVLQHTLSNTTTTLAFSLFNYYVNGAPVRKAAGTQALTATTHDVAIDKWASYRVSIAVGGTVTITKQSAAEDNTEDAAIVNLAATPANEANMGYFTVRGGSAAIFDATTNNLQSGAVTGMIVHFYPSTPVLKEAITSLL